MSRNRTATRKPTARTNRTPGRKPTAPRHPAMDRSAGLAAWLLAGVSGIALLAAAAPLEASAQTPPAERVYREEALAHARAVAEAWRRLETHILAESTGPVAWPGPVPPAETGWRAAWTERGLRAGYCEDVLLVYLAPGRLKGVGRDHRSVHAAPHAYDGDAAAGQSPVLHWLEDGEARGSVGRATVVLPECLSDGSPGGVLPSGRAALAGAVRDPYRHTDERIARERREEACGDGEHGDGRVLIRETVQEHNGRGEPVGDPAHGPWQISIDGCRADYSHWEHYTLACHWEAGPPHDRRMQGRDIWRRLKTVTAGGMTLGAPEFVSTSCWTGGTPPAPAAAISESDESEAKTEGCPAGYSGSRGYRRTVTMRGTQFPWDAAPVMQSIRGPWILDSDDCREIVEPDWGGPDGGGDPGGPGGSGSSGGDSCGSSDSADAGGDTCGGDGSGGGDGGGSGGCFLTQAIVAHRGAEADNGPTLTALRAFRDGYMMRTAERRALVAEYYAIAPAIAAAIPRGHPDWDWIGGRIDAAAAAIGAGNEDAAFRTYVAMVRRLAARWPAQSVPASVDAGAGKGGRS